MSGAVPPGHAQAIVYEGPGRLTLRAVPIPSTGPDDMLVEVELCGVDGSELHMFRGELGWINDRAPLIFGDEIIGRVSAIGPAAEARRGLAIGDRVTIEARWPCATCPEPGTCQYFRCDNNPGRRGYGAIGLADPPGLWGGYASHVHVPREALAYRIPDAMAAGTALVAGSVFANGLRWSELSGAAPGKTLAIIGPGPQGLGCALAANQLGARVLVIGLEQDSVRLACAARYGADTVAIGAGEAEADVVARCQALVGPVDAVIELAGSSPAKSLAFALVRSKGLVANASVPFPAVQPFDWMGALMKELTVINPVSHPHMVARALEAAAALLAQGVNVGDLITHVFPLADAEQALCVAAYETDERPVKVALDPRRSA